MNKLTKFLSIALIPLLLTACDLFEEEEGKTTGGNGDIDGIYSIFSSEGGGSSIFESVALIEGGQIRAFTENGGLYAGGIADHSDGTFDARYTQYSSGNKAVDTVTLAGDFQSGKSFEGLYESDSGTEGALKANYNAQAHKQPASLDIASGVWSVTNSSVNNSISINTNGDLYGSDADGCVYSGNLSVPDRQRNIYRVSMTVESCGNTNGLYTGLAARGANDQGDTLMMITNNQSYSFHFQLQRQ